MATNRSSVTLSKLNRDLDVMATLLRAFNKLFKICCDGTTFGKCQILVMATLPRLASLEDVQNDSIFSCGTAKMSLSLNEISGFKS